MGPVAFLRAGWRRKDRDNRDKPQTYLRDSARGSSASLLPLQSMPRAAQSTPSLNNKADHDTCSDIVNSGGLGQPTPEPLGPVTRPRTFSAGAPRRANDPFHGPPINVKHGPPHNTSHGPPPRSPLFLSSFSAIPKTPSRPARPPDLDLGTPLPDWPSKDTDTTPRVKFSIPSPGAMPQDEHPQRRSDSPHLDGVWEGFLLEAEGDLDILDLYTMIPSAAPDRKFPPPKPSSLRPSTSPSAINAKSMRSHRMLFASQSTTSLPQSDWHQPKGSADRPGNSADTLSLFPSPPSLKVRRRKGAPTPLVLLPTASVAPLPPSPSVTTPDTTPVATPNTSCFPQSPYPHSIRKRRSKEPTSILKKRPSTTNSSLPTSPETLSPVSPLETPYAQLPPVRPLRVTKSASHITLDLQKPASVHRPTQSDSASLSRYAKPRLVTTAIPPPVPPKNDYLPPSYLQSQGRSRPQTYKQGIPTVEWGYAV